MKFTLINDENCEDECEMSVQEILADINEPDTRSEDWTDYNEKDWMEGLLVFTQWVFILPKDFKMFKKGVGVVRVSWSIVVRSMSEIITTDRGEFPLHELEQVEPNIVTQ